MGTCFTLYIVDEKPDLYLEKRCVSFMMDLGKDYDLAMKLEEDSLYEEIGSFEIYESFEKQYAFSNFQKQGRLPMSRAIELLKDAPLLSSEIIILAVMNRLSFLRKSPEFWVVLERDQ